MGGPAPTFRSLRLGLRCVGLVCLAATFQAAAAGRLVADPIGETPSAPGAPRTSPTRPADIRGTLRNIETGEAIDLATVAVLDGRGSVVTSAASDAAGSFLLPRVPARPYALVVQRFGYRPLRVEGVVAGTPEATSLALVLVPSPIVIDPIVVSASRRRETGLRSPASTTVVPQTRIEETIPATPVEPVRTAPGVDFASKGLLQHTFSVRGSRGVNSAAFLVLSDYRIAGLPSIGFNIPYLMPSVPDDIERIEISRGPGAALYGPDTDRGILHFIPRSAFDSPGTKLYAAGGERSVAQAGFRHARVLTEELAVKISGDFFRGDDWTTVDSVEIAAREAALAQGASPETLRIGKRETEATKAGGEARVEWRPRIGTSLVVTGGLNQAGDLVDLTPTAGAVQVRDWRYGYVQTQLKRDRLFLNAVLNASDAGDSYLLRTGAPLVDDSRVWVAQVQHGAHPRWNSDLLYGIDVRTTEPRTGGTIHGRNEDHDTMTEVGAYVHASSIVSRTVDLIAALRADYHDRIENLSLSPRAGIVFRPDSSNTFRLVYNRGFNSPAAVDLFVDLVTGSAGPYDLRLFGVPKGGLSFSRGNGGPFMRSPLAGDLGLALPPDATLVWDGAVALLAAQGFDLSGVPPPTSAEVGSDLRLLDLESGTFRPTSVAEISDIEPLERRITNSFEAGYRRLLGRGFSAVLDVYVNHVENESGGLVVATPNVFFEQATLAQYLQGYMSPDSAAVAAEVLAGIPVGTVTPREAGDSADLLLITRQGGSTTTWGSDLNLDIEITNEIWGSATYSWLNRNIVRDVVGIGDVVLGVPRNKGAVSLGYRRHDGTFSTTATARAVESFLVRNGVYDGRVDGYGVLDVEASWRPPTSQRLRLTVSARNVFDHRHRELTGAPEIGRLIVSRLEVDI